MKLFFSNYIIFHSPQIALFILRKGLEISKEP